MDTPDAKLPDIPAKRYFTIGEVAELCGVKPYVLRYWEQEFTQLRPMKRRGNRRYYQHHEVLLIRRIRDLLYDQGFTISGARNRLQDSASHDAPRDTEVSDAAASAGADISAPTSAATGENQAVQGTGTGTAAAAQRLTVPGTDPASPAAAALSAAAGHWPPVEPLPDHPTAAQVRRELLAIREMLV